MKIEEIALEWALSDDWELWQEDDFVGSGYYYRDFDSEAYRHWVYLVEWGVGVGRNLMVYDSTWEDRWEDRDDLLYNLNGGESYENVNSFLVGLIIEGFMEPLIW